jgi:predicted secreted protein
VAQFAANEYHQGDAATAQKTGTAGIEVWTFKAVAPGQTLIRFEYVRSSDRDSPVARQYVFALTVQ